MEDIHSSMHNMDNTHHPESYSNLTDEYMDELYETGSIDSYGNISFHENASMFTDTNYRKKSHRNRWDSPGNVNKQSGDYVELDVGHYRMFTKVKGKRIPIEFYMTKVSPGTLIRNAISGIRENSKYVGKKDEDTFFKVKLCCNYIGQNPYGVLYYNSPEEYERHFYTTVPEKIKGKWMKHNMTAMGVQTF
jgi:hypothetical protein